MLSQSEYMELRSEYAIAKKTMLRCVCVCVRACVRAYAIAKKTML